MQILRRIKGNREKIRTRKILLAALLSNGFGVGLLSGTTPASAAGTAANTVISNPAAATYNDPNNAGTMINATSNTVTVTVAEVDGITVGAETVTDPAHPGNVLPGDLVSYDFLVTNIGNGANTFALPGTATVTGNGAAGTLQYRPNRCRPAFGLDDGLFHHADKLPLEYRRCRPGDLRFRRHEDYGLPQSHPGDAPRRDRSRHTHRLL